MTAYGMNESVISQLMGAKTRTVDNHIEIGRNIVQTFQFPGHDNSTVAFEILQVKRQQFRRLGNVSYKPMTESAGKLSQ